jgi:hypothetical protein
MITQNYACYGAPKNDEERMLRRRSYLVSAISNEIDNSGGRGATVFVVGWAQQPAFQVELQGTAQNNEYETLFIFSLPTTFTGISDTVSIPPGLQTWTIADQENPNTRQEVTP